MCVWLYRTVSLPLYLHPSYIFSFHLLPYPVHLVGLILLLHIYQSSQASLPFLLCRQRRWIRRADSARVDTFVDLATRCVCYLFEEKAAHFDIEEVFFFVSSRLNYLYIASSSRLEKLQRFFLRWEDLTYSFPRVLSVIWEGQLRTPPETLWIITALSSYWGT